MFKVQLKSTPLSSIKTQSVLGYLFENSELDYKLKELDKKSNYLISSALNQEKFKGKFGKCLFIHTPNLATSSVNIIGLGKKNEFEPPKLKEIAGIAAKFLQQKKITKIATYIPEIYDLEKITEQLVKGIIIGSYQFTEYKTSKTEILPEINQVIIQEEDQKKHQQIKRGIKSGEIIGTAINLVRDYGNQPSNKATPSYLVEKAREIAKKQKKLTCKILEEDDMKKLKMGALLGVASGAKQPPKFIILKYLGNPKTKKNIVLVGKAITFDAGGISLKPSQKMEEMKFDMSGGGTVIGTIKAVSDLGLKVNLIGLVPATENLPSGEAYKPGDILISSSGKTIEVINTDAEGRLILADALSYAGRFKPSAVIDLATLTGACMVALGKYAAGLFGNNKKLIEKVKQASKISGERVWELPLWKEYFEEMKSDIADLKNVGGKYGGAITAAAFLANFAESYPWIHLDIAPTAWVDRDYSYFRKGATGWGVDLLVEFVRML